MHGQRDEIPVRLSESREVERAQAAHARENRGGKQPESLRRAMEYLRSHQTCEVCDRAKATVFTTTVDIPIAMCSACRDQMK